MEKSEWFVDWFNSPYYHLLYNNRNEQEADFFIGNLCAHLGLPRGARIWDLACGRGRHTLSLARKGYNATGTDLSPNSIREATRAAGGAAEFLVHDMREPFRSDAFDAVFNLFTSIGYFENYQDNFRVFSSAATALKPGGFFVVDFLNAARVLASLKPEYTEDRGEVQFHIRKKVKNNCVFKSIAFSEHGRDHCYHETVSLLRLGDFTAFADAAHLALHETFGNYALQPFDEAASDRLIMVFRK